MHCHIVIITGSLYVVEESSVWQLAVKLFTWYLDTWACALAIV